MLRVVGATIRELARQTACNNLNNICALRKCLDVNRIRNFSAFTPQITNNRHYGGPIINPISTVPTSSILSQLLQVNKTPVRTLVKFSWSKGKRKSVKSVTKRFYRLNWGIWIRPRAGKNRCMWKKSANQRRRRKLHVFTNSTQSWLLDKMTTKYWHRPRYYPEDIYNPYHVRNEYPLTRRIPRIPVDGKC